jgi:hypothetical protein
MIESYRGNPEVCGFGFDNQAFKVAANQVAGHRFEGELKLICF